MHLHTAGLAPINRKPQPALRRRLGLHRTGEADYQSLGEMLAVDLEEQQVVDRAARFVAVQARVLVAEVLEQAAPCGALSGRTRSEDHSGAMALSNSACRREPMPWDCLAG